VAQGLQRRHAKGESFLEADNYMRMKSFFRLDLKGIIGLPRKKAVHVGN
jgi:hypothetical protein